MVLRVRSADIIHSIGSSLDIKRLKPHQMRLNAIDVPFLQQWTNGQAVHLVIRDNEETENQSPMVQLVRRLWTEYVHNNKRVKRWLAQSLIVKDRHIGELQTFAVNQYDRGDRSREEKLVEHYAPL